MLKLLRGKTAAKDDAEHTSEDNVIADESTAPTNPDDAMSRTLTQALELLDQDYEDEASASQMVAQTEVAKAFLAQKKRNQSSD